MSCSLEHSCAYICDSTWTDYPFVASTTISPVDPLHLVKYMPSSVAPIHFHVIVLLHVCLSFKTVPFLTIRTRKHNSQEHHFPFYFGVIFQGCSLEFGSPLALIGTVNSPILCSLSLAKHLVKRHLDAR